MKKTHVTASLLLAAFLAAGGIPAAFDGSAVSFGAGSAAGYWEQEMDGGENRWVYMDETGQRLTSCRKEIDGKTYFFDENGYMLSGWVSSDGEAVSDFQGQGYLDGTYYCGGPDEGWAVTGWKYISIFRDDIGAERKWFYFKESGRKAVDTSITEEDSEGKYQYTFDEDGILKSSKKLGSSLRMAENSSGQWIQRVPGASQDSYASENGIKRWYYGRQNGSVAKNGIRTIQGKKYLFDSAGIMRAGLVAVNKNGKYVETLIYSGDDKNCDLDELEALASENVLMYFDEETGEMRTGKAKILTEDGEKEFLFLQSGKAAHREYQDRLYAGGLLKKADKDLKYEVITVDEEEYLVNTSGKIQGRGRYEDKDGVVWIVERKNGVYEITPES